MEENPYKAPVEFRMRKPAPKDERWHPFTWGVIGFALGTFFVTQLVLSPDRIQRAIGGTIWGGLPAGLFFFMSAVARRRKGS